MSGFEPRELAVTSWRATSLALPPDPLVRGMDPRIRIHTKISWIRNTASNTAFLIQTQPTTLLRIPWWACWRSGGAGRAWTGGGEWRRGAGQHGSHSWQSASPAPAINILDWNGWPHETDVFFKNFKKVNNFCKYAYGQWLLVIKIFCCIVVMKANTDKSQLKLVKLLQKAVY